MILSIEAVEGIICEYEVGARECEARSSPHGIMKIIVRRDEQHELYR